MPTKLPLNDSSCIFQSSYQGFAWFECKEAYHLRCNCFWFWEFCRFSMLRSWLLLKCIPFFHTSTQYSHKLRVFHKSLSFTQWGKRDFSWTRLTNLSVCKSTSVQCISKWTLQKGTVSGLDCTHHSWYRLSNRVEVLHHLWGLRSTLHESQECSFESSFWFFLDAKWRGPWSEIWCNKTDFTCPAYVFQAQVFWKNLTKIHRLAFSDFTWPACKFQYSCCNFFAKTIFRPANQSADIPDSFHTANTAFQWRNSCVRSTRVWVSWRCTWLIKFNRTKCRPKNSTLQVISWIPRSFFPPNRNESLLKL